MLNLTLIDPNGAYKEILYAIRKFNDSVHAKL